MDSVSAPLAGLTEVCPPAAPKVEVDDFDLALLRALASDARQSQRALARGIEMSAPAVADRLARLERGGVIRGYRVDIDWAALGYPVVVYVAVTAGAGMDLSEIIKSIGAMPEAEDMSVVTGGLDLLVRLRVRDHAHLRELLLTQIFTINGVQRTETFLSLADVELPNFTAALLEQMSELRGAPPDRRLASDQQLPGRRRRRGPARVRRSLRPVHRGAGRRRGGACRPDPRSGAADGPVDRGRPARRAARQGAVPGRRDRRHDERPGCSATRTSATASRCLSMAAG